jgi:hypothetical protein
MRRPFTLAAVGLAAVGLSAAGLGLAAAGTTSTSLSAKLTAPAEKPRPKGAAKASGTFAATLSGSTLVWRLTFSRLTGRAVAAHVHLGRAGVAGPVAIPLCGPCVSGVHGKVRVTAKVRSALLAGGTYVNVHTAKNAAGEIRGQIARRGGGVGTTTADSSQTTTDDSGGGSPGGYGGYG